MAAMICVGAARNSALSMTKRLRISQSGEPAQDRQQADEGEAARGERTTHGRVLGSADGWGTRFDGGQHSGRHARALSRACTSLPRSRGWLERARP